MHAIVPKIEPATAPPQLTASFIVEPALSIFGLDQARSNHKRFTCFFVSSSSSAVAAADAHNERSQPKGSETHSMRDAAYLIAAEVFFFRLRKENDTHNRYNNKYK